MNDTLSVICLMDFYKSGKGENAKGLSGEIIQVSPALAEFLIEKNIVVLYDEIYSDNAEQNTWQQ